MKKLYFIAPLAALGLFAAYTLHFNKEYDIREERKAAEQRSIKETKIKAESEARKKALDEAMAIQQKLKKDRADKEAEEMRKKEARQAAIDARDKNFREQEKLSRQIERTKKDIKVEQEAIAKLDASIKFNQAEKIFIGDFSTKAQQNIKSLSDLLVKIDAAEAARAAATAQAAKSNS